MQFQTGSVGAVIISVGLIVSAVVLGVPGIVTAGAGSIPLTAGELVEEYHTPDPPLATPVRNHDTGERFATIQAAIDDPDTTAGHTLSVAPGRYQERVNVTKSVRLRGAQVRVTTIAAPSSFRHAVTVTADDVVLTGFTIEGPGPVEAVPDGLGGVRDPGVGVWPTRDALPIAGLRLEANGAVVTGNVFVGFHCGVLFSPLGSTDHQVTVNRFERNYRGVCSRRVGSPATPSVADLRVRDNDFVNNSVEAELTGTGHLIGGNRFVDRGGLAVDGADIRVERNVIDLGSPLFRSRPGRGLVASGENVTVVANRITVPFGLAARGTGVDHTWRDNRIRDSASGLVLPTATGFVLRNNRIANVSEDAFGVGLTGLGGPLGDALFDHDIDRSNTVDGRPIVYVNNERSCIGPLPSRDPDCIEDVVFDGDDMAAFYCRYCMNVTLRDLSLSGTLVGVHLQTSRAVRIESVDVGGNRYGIRIAGAVSRDNVVRDSRVRGNRLAGIVLKGVAVRTEVRRNVVSESRYGIVLIADQACPADTVVASNVIERNRVRGFVYACPASSGRGNLVYNNRFNNSWPDGSGGGFHANAMVAQHPRLGPLTWNTSARVGTNVAGGPRIGGNYWGTPEGDGFSDLCSDADGDGFCDRPFVVSHTGAPPNTDYLPLARWAR